MRAGRSPASPPAPRAGTSPARRSRASPGASPTWWPRWASVLDVLRVDGGLTNERLLLELQADAIGAPVERGTADATVLGAAALAAVGAGILDRPADIAPLLATDERVEPRRDDGWRESEHEAWRRFVKLALELPGG